MQVYHGKSVCGGIAIGKVSVYGRPEGRVEREEKQNQEAEICRTEESFPAERDRGKRIPESFRWNFIITATQSIS